MPDLGAEIGRLGHYGFGHTIPLDGKFKIYWVASLLGILFYIKIDDFLLVLHLLYFNDCEI